MLVLILLGAVLLALIAVLLFPWVAGSRFSDYCAQEGRHRYGRARISTLYPHLRTGDILLFSARASLIPIATQSQFTHAAMVVRRPGPRCGAQCRQQWGGALGPEPGSALTAPAPAPGAAHDCIDCDVMIAEVCGGISDGKLAEGFMLPAGAVLSPLLARLKYYPGAAYVMRLSRIDNLSSSLSHEAAAAIDSALSARLGRPFAPPASIMLATLLGQPTFHCYGLVSQLVDAALRRADAASEGAPPLSSESVLGVVPAVAALQNAQMVDASGARYVYRPLVEILYDIDSE